MKNLLNPKWLIIIHLVPVILLFSIFYSEFQIIKTLLSEESILLWYRFGITLFVLTIIHLIYTVTTILRHKEISVIYAFSSLIIYTTFLYTYNSYSSDIIPWNIPRWMFSGNLIRYTGTFLMPTLAHSLFVIVIKFTSKEKEHKAWVSFLLSLSIPLIAYLFVQISLPLWKHVDYKFEQHIIIIASIIAVILFLFFLVRSIYILSIRKGKQWKDVNSITKFIVGILLPVIGLALNNGLIGNNFSGAFGNFNSLWFYIISVFNGILICLPDLDHKIYRLLLFVGRTITFSFTSYFFIIFLPYLPLSVIAIVAIGIGFLMLTPLVLFVIHIQELSYDFKYLKKYYSKRALITLSLIGFFIIPSVITLTFYSDKQVLNETLNYIYTPDYSKDYLINKSSLENTLKTVKSNKTRNSDFLFSPQTPYISSLFNWIVLDNLTLSDSKINTIENIFFKNKPFELRSERLRNIDVEISKIGSTSTYNKEEGFWTSWINIEITNANKNNFTSEYATTIDLPDGCWINDYYLYVGDRKEMGILAEKKSAMWIFSEIRNINRDPGLLHYLTGNKVSFRVFPFAKNEVRKTGIQCIHKEPIILSIDDHKLSLGEDKPLRLISQNDTNENVIYVSSKEKENLKNVNRTPYYHFIIDTSKEKDSLINSYIKTLETFVKKNHLSTENAKISFTNSYTNTINFNDNWKGELKNKTFDGGFYLERAIKKVLYHAYIKPSNQYPIIITITDNMLDAIISKNFSDFKIAYPENNLFYHLNTLGYLASHDLNTNPKQFINIDTSIQFGYDVLAWPNLKKPLVYLPNDSLPNIVLKSSNIELTNTMNTSHWNSGLLMQGKWISDVLHPENSERDWNNSVKMSFKSKIMTPLTSYIVVETEAQKMVLKKKQEQVLNGKKSLDLNESTQRMSEPGYIIILILFSIFFFLRKGKLFN